MTNIIDKIGQAIGLAKRIQNELGSGSFDNALYLTDTFVFLFSGHQAATRELVTSYTAVSRELLNDGKVEQAEALILKGLIIDPQNSQMLSILVEIKKAQHRELRELGRPSLGEPEPFPSHGHPQVVKLMAREFIYSNFPEEIPFFDILWRALEGISSKNFKRQISKTAFALTGWEVSDLKTPKVIALLNQLGSRDIRSLSDNTLKEFITKKGRAIGCPKKFVNLLIVFFVKNRPNSISSDKT